MKLIIEGTDEIRELGFRGCDGREIGAETLIGDGCELGWNKNLKLYTIGAADFARMERLIDKTTVALKEMMNAYNRILTVKNSERVREIFEEESNAVESFSDCPSCFERIKTRLEDEIELPFAKKARH